MRARQDNPGALAALDFTRDPAVMAVLTEAMRARKSLSAGLFCPGTGARLSRIPPSGRRVLSASAICSGELRRDGAVMHFAADADQREVMRGGKLNSAASYILKASPQAA